MNERQEEVMITTPWERELQLCDTIYLQDNFIIPSSILFYAHLAQ